MTRRATTPQAKSAATLRAGASLPWGFVARSVEYRCGYTPSRAPRPKANWLPANCVLLRDAGDHLPQVPSFEEKYGMKGTALVEMPAEVGIAKILQMKMVKVKDRRDMKEKASLFSSELRDGTVVYVHGWKNNAAEAPPGGTPKDVERFQSALSELVGGRKSTVRFLDHARGCFFIRTIYPNPRYEQA